jgi:hypothetical protein
VLVYARLPRHSARCNVDLTVLCSALAAYVARVLLRTCACDRPFIEKVWELSANNIIVVSAIGNDGTTPRWHV